MSLFNATRILLYNNVVLKRVLLINHHSTQKKNQYCNMHTEKITHIKFKKCTHNEIYITLKYTTSEGYLFERFIFSV